MNGSRGLVAEAIGTASLLMIVIGSGIMGERLSDGNVAIALLANSLTTGFGLYVLISVFAPVSGAHFNPIVSLLHLFDRNMDAPTCLAYVVVQVIAASVGVLLAHAIFDCGLFQIGTHHRTGISQWLSEAIATAGLIVTIRGTSKRGAIPVAAAVGSYVAAAYWFTASTSFANPAVTIARSFTTTFAGIAPGDAVGFIVAQFIGAFVGASVARFLFAGDR